ncbi:S9 family peptidase [Olivibacter sp. XZL3]|uniref:S9 family peptidase n=1 Tax=Olivibacter sp. XZL3 TaxID=1735116 RepID=UPI001981FD8F|nr:S9 family peptidase [Olivibacter sp. XZL3]
MIKRLLVFKITFLIAAAVSAQEVSPSIEVTDMLQIQRVTHLDISTDKKLLLFNLQKIKEREGDSGNYEYDNQLWMAKNEQPYTLRQLTYSEQRASQPTFSPDGKDILFVRTVKGKSQLFLMSLSGGEPMQLTDFKYGATEPKWSPDGTKIIFTASIKIDELLADSLLSSPDKFPLWLSEKPGFSDNTYLGKTKDKADPNGNMAEIRAYLRQNERAHKAKVINKLQFQGEASTSSDMQFSHLFVIDVSNRLSPTKPKAVTSGFNSYNDPYFCSNNEVLVNAKLNDTEFPDRVLESAIYKIDLRGGSKQTLIGEKERSFRIGSVSPSGKYLVYSESAVGTPNVPKVFVRALKDGRDLISIPLDRNMNNFKWTPKEEEVYFTAQSNGGVPLYKFSLKGTKLEKLSSEDAGVDDYVIGEKTLVYAKTSVENPCELAVADLNMKQAKVVSSFNTNWLNGKKLSLPEKHIFKNDEGMDVEYWVMKPVNFEEGKKYPLLLEIHGGPSAMWGPGESSMWHEYQFFCAKGYGVVYSNPRGSGGYGEKFLRANMDNWGKGPASDVLEALDRTVAEGWADTSRLLLTGGSYAGYLVSWIIGHDQRFKAACSQRGVYDLKTFFGEGNAWRLVPNYFGGYPWEERTMRVIERESPINYVENIKTPYIIFHGEQDLRTGVIQSEMLYKSLKVLGRPVEYVRHPGATHEITRSGDNRQRIDQMLRTYEFFERFIN